MGGMETRGNLDVTVDDVRFLRLTPSVLGFCTTPPLPSSSPAQLLETMEMSPLPHKAPFCNQVEITSPTPISTPSRNDEDDEEMMLDSPAPISRQPSVEPIRPSIVE
jgi:M-phase inducer tyrosine phosphatase